MRILVITTGYVIIAVSLWLLISAFVLVLAYSNMMWKKPSAIGVVRDVQRLMYFEGLRRIWQQHADCIEFDEKLAYVPRLGRCTFSNLEFDTSLHFTPLGRHIHYQETPKGRPILVLGDSHAMGWGVNDGETFSQVLADITQRPVFNLAVSSYGTARELATAVGFERFADADTIIIQYCNNDIGENKAYANETAESIKLAYQRMVSPPEKPPQLQS